MSNEDLLRKIETEFSTYRKSKGVSRSAKGFRYPEELRLLILKAKNRGLSYAQLTEASGLSKGGIEKLVSELRKKHPTTKIKKGKPGRPSVNTKGALPTKKTTKSKNSEAAGKGSVKSVLKSIGIDLSQTSPTAAESTSAVYSPRRQMKAKSEMREDGMIQITLILPGGIESKLLGHPEEIATLLSIMAKR